MVVNLWQNLSTDVAKGEARFQKILMITDTSLMPKRGGNRISVNLQAKAGTNRRRIADPQSFSICSHHILWAAIKAHHRKSILNGLRRLFQRFCVNFSGNATPSSASDFNPLIAETKRRTELFLRPPPFNEEKVSRVRRTKRRPCRRRCKVLPNRASHHGASFRKAASSARALQKRRSDGL